MTAIKCVCCDGYGRRPRPAWEPGTAPVTCVACEGKGVLCEPAPTPVLGPWLPVAPQPTPLLPWSPYDPITPWGPVVTWTTDHAACAPMVSPQVVVSHFQRHGERPEDAQTTLEPGKLRLVAPCANVLAAPRVEGCGAWDANAPPLFTYTRTGTEVTS